MEVFDGLQECFGTITESVWDDFSSLDSNNWSRECNKRA